MPLPFLLVRPDGLSPTSDYSQIDAPDYQQSAQTIGEQLQRLWSSAEFLHTSTEKKNAVGQNPNVGDLQIQNDTPTGQPVLYSPATDYMLRGLFSPSPSPKYCAPAGPTGSMEDLRRSLSLPPVNPSNLPGGNHPASSSGSQENSSEAKVDNQSTTNFSPTQDRDQDQKQDEDKYQDQDQDQDQGQDQGHDQDLDKNQDQDQDQDTPITSRGGPPGLPFSILPFSPNSPGFPTGGSRILHDTLRDLIANEYRKQGCRVETEVPFSKYPDIALSKPLRTIIDMLRACPPSYQVKGNDEKSGWFADFTNNQKEINPYIISGNSFSRSPKIATFNLPMNQRLPPIPIDRIWTAGPGEPVYTRPYP